MEKITKILQINLVTKSKADNMEEGTRMHFNMEGDSRVATRVLEYVKTPSRRYALEKEKTTRVVIKEVLVYIRHQLEENQIKAAKVMNNKDGTARASVLY